MTDDDDYDSLYDDLTVSLRSSLLKQGWANPVQLEAAFDTLGEARDLVRGLSIGGGSHFAIEGWGNELYDWKVKHANRIRTTRRRLANSGTDYKWEVVTRARIGPTPISSTLHGTGLSSLIPSLCTLAHWKTTRTKALREELTDNERQDVERIERDRWIGKLVLILQEIQAPSYLLSETAADPEAAIRRVVGKGRARTIRARVKQWMKISTWLSAVHGVPFPLGMGMMLDYLTDMEGGYFGKTIPTSIACALSYIEKMAGFSPADRISTQVFWNQSISAMTLRAELSCAGKSIKKAPQFFVSMLVSLELFVCSTRSDFHRAFAWTKLLKHWCGLRYDDVQAVDQARLFLGPHCLKAILSRTKTTGPGKATFEAAIYCSVLSSITGLNWLAVGYNLWKSDRFNFPRDYFLPHADKTWDYPKRGMMSYSECSANSRALLLDLHVPVRSFGAWRESPLKLLKAPAHLFWTEHSERHFCVSVGACIGLDLEATNSIGRWGINKRQSADYILTSRQMVLSAQKKIMQALSTGPCEYDEFELADQLKSFLIKRDDQCNVEDHVDPLMVLKQGPTGYTLQQPFPMNSNGSAGDPPDETAAGEPIVTSDADSDGEAGTDSRKESDYPYWICTSASGFRRLHKCGGCNIAKIGMASWAYVTVQEVQANKADAPCLRCWPEFKDDEGSSSSEESSSDSSSSEPMQTVQFPSLGNQLVEASGSDLEH